MVMTSSVYMDRRLEKRAQKPANLQPALVCHAMACREYSPIVSRSTTAIVNKYMPMKRSATARLMYKKYMRCGFFLFLM